MKKSKFLVILALTLIMVASAIGFSACTQNPAGTLTAEKVKYNKMLEVGDTVETLKGDTVTIDGVVDRENEAWSTREFLTLDATKENHGSFNGTIVIDEWVDMSCLFLEDGVVLALTVRYEYPVPVWHSNSRRATHNTGVELYLMSGNANQAGGWDMEIDINANGAVNAKKLDPSATAYQSAGALYPCVAACKVL
ncbi:MAG: hypothetical protein MJ072_06310, partial [Clostridia bacterium]|nr:hypothetical protein [Clostridia bacterium]